MSFQTGLSGLNASSQMLDVIGNNIANANTVGNKESRVEFSNIVAAAIGSGGGGSGQGIGVDVATISQKFTQGNLSVTNNNMDLAINGNGMFQVKRTDGTTAYTRDGQFKLDKSGNILTNTGANVMGYPTDATGAPTSITSQKLVVPTTAPIAASATTAITAALNLDSRAQIASEASPPTPRATYGTSVTTYDSQGNAVPETLYFTKVNPANSSESPIGVTNPPTDQWAIYDSLAPTAKPVGYMSFNATGAIAGTFNASGVATTAVGKLPLTITNTANPTAGALTPTLDMTGVTQFGTNFAVSNLSQNGYTSGNFTSLTIDSKGVITTNYSNGQTMKTGGMVALGNFRNVQGLTDVGHGEYLESYKSGAVVMGNPSVGQFGEIRSGSIEESNVDLTSELVNMMTAQRNYQANAQTIKTQDQVMSTLVNMR